MTYRVMFTEKARKELKKLDRQTAAFLTGWIHRNLEGCENPRAHGKGLTANNAGLRRYRVGDYRLIAEIRENEIVIYLLNIGHRSNVYMA
ncbi:MAG: type II toxin-antitoxin system RelE/ParE family toxin [Oscillospiraceae bacterium]